ncbi:DUF3450 family protein [bacterium]|nr:DUF3450 family protein [bacterium]
MSEHNVTVKITRSFFIGLLLAGWVKPLLHAEENKSHRYEKMVAAHKTARHELHYPIADTMTLDKLVRHLTEIQQQVELEKQAGQEEQSRLERMEALLVKEKALLKKEIRTMEQNKHANRAKRIKWRAEQERYRRVLAASQVQLKQAEEDLLKWKTKLPSSLAKEMEKMFDQLKTAGNRSVSQRLQTITGLYAKIELYQKSINTAKEVLVGDDGKQREYAVIYLGLAQGYCVSVDNRQAGIGRPGINGWQWEWRSDLAVKVRKCIAYHEHRQIADFVLLPVKVERDLP